MIKYSKSFDGVKILIDRYLEGNDLELEETRKIDRIYRKQPIRVTCKLCGGGIDKDRSFVSHGIEYYFCPKCGHVNGQFQETENFTKHCYTSEDADYGRNYREKDKEAYIERVDKIYVPKASFLLDVFRENDIQYRDFSFLDVGAGSGYFVKALRSYGLDAKGIELSEQQVDFGNHMMGTEVLQVLEQEKVSDYIEDSQTDVISFIGVLEHVINLDEILESVKENKNIKYIYFSVPMMSYSVMFEAISPKIYNRLLGGDHTHLFTNESLEYLYNKFGWKVKGEWRFGADAADLMRIIDVMMRKDGNDYLSGIFENKYVEIINDIQSVFDKNDYCSEIHVVAEIAH